MARAIQYNTTKSHGQLLYHLPSLINCTKHINLSNINSLEISCDPNFSHFIPQNVASYIVSPTRNFNLFNKNCLQRCNIYKCDRIIISFALKNLSFPASKAYFKQCKVLNFYKKDLQWDKNSERNDQKGEVVTVSEFTMEILKSYGNSVPICMLKRSASAPRTSICMINMTV